MATEILTWEQVIRRGFKEVTVESYGYDEVHIYGSHYEPFKNKRSFIFFVSFPCDDNGNEIYDENLDRYSLNHKWLNLNNFERNLDFELREDGKVYLNDPDLWAK